MSKWISGFLPSKSGNYLVKTELKVYTGVSISYIRLEFNSLTGKWFHGNNLPVIMGLSGDNYIKYWWDEYGITESRIVRKLNFKHGKV